MSQFYLQDSRSHVGDGLTFWALGGGYTTNLDKAELFTAEQATTHRDTDIPWPKAYIDERAHLGVDHQYISKTDSAAQPTEGCQCVLQIQQQWNGNDILFAKWPISGTDRLERAHRVTLEAAIAIGDDELTIWPLDYIVARARRLVHRQDVDLKQALRGTGIKPPKPRRVRKQVFNCQGCGRFIPVSECYLSDCKNCGADNCP
ncbi:MULTISPECIES: hypothetical protein [Pseudomonas]|uniref:hypothetical protein n=1 Tax=Pseudomonas TaxID=286 RepID=UPI001AE7A778|nr:MULTISPECIES: hypothetical protein [unclassified Pseudomonas]MBP1086058.1 hypothetical protein [Pseudomonas sp. PvP007]MBP1192907.1 hypothetical protein [Pseudomonas sp. PvP100]